MNPTQAMELTPRKQARNHETILVVEDDEPLLRLLRFFLVDAGYVVLCATNGEEAVDTFVKHQAEIDLVVTDLGLPGLSGREEIMALEQIDPNVPIVCASGYLDPGVKLELLRAGAKGIINKPYAPQEILQKVRAVLDSTLSLRLFAQHGRKGGCFD